MSGWEGWGHIYLLHPSSSLHSSTHSFISFDQKDLREHSMLLSQKAHLQYGMFSPAKLFSET
jgi:hypothetical protein